MEITLGHHIEGDELTKFELAKALQHLVYQLMTAFNG